MTTFHPDEGSDATFLVDPYHIVCRECKLERLRVTRLAPAPMERLNFRTRKPDERIPVPQRAVDERQRVVARWR